MRNASAQRDEEWFKFWKALRLGFLRPTGDNPPNPTQGIRMDALRRRGVGAAALEILRGFLQGTLRKLAGWVAKIEL